MATEGGGKEMNEIKTQFTTREGLYKLLPHSEYSRPNRVPFNSQGSNPVRVSFVNLNDQSGNGDRLCFNVGRELYFYIYKGVRKAADLSKPIDKRIYKGTQPTCHDFNHLTATAESVSLLVGFSAGQVQLIDPIKKETSKLFNEERRDFTMLARLVWNSWLQVIHPPQLPKARATTPGQHRGLLYTGRQRTSRRKWCVLS
uniref:WD repeat domain 20 n=2 Tax=Rhinopithecus TaxID=542827 RepID=A0A2K6MFH2_RHIBE